MFTAVVDSACARFEQALARHLGGDLAVSGTRVTADSHGWRVRCRLGPLPRDHELSFMAPRASSPGPRSALSWRLDATGEEGAGHEPGLGERWVDRLGPRLGGDAGAPVVELIERLRAEVRLPEPRRSPLDGIEAGLLRGALGADGALLARTAGAFHRYYGEPLRLVWFDEDAAPSVEFPPVVRDQELLMYAPPPLRQDARNLAYLADLGFAVDPRGRLATVPTPRAFGRRRARLGARGGLRPELQHLPMILFSPTAWVQELARGVLPINVHGPTAQGLATAAGAVGVPPVMRPYLNNHFHALGHDMGVHALAMHRVPAPQMDELRGLASLAVSRGRAAAKRAAAFFEERLTRACLDVWAEARRPEDFPTLFLAVYPTLRAELDAAAGGRGARGRSSGMDGASRPSRGRRPGAQTADTKRDRRHSG